MTKSEKGSVLLLVALLLVALVGFVALAIDSSLIATSKAQHHHTTEMVALAALERFLETKESTPGIPATHEEKMQEAEARAAQVLGTNVKSLLSRTRFENSADSQNDLNSYGIADQAQGINGNLIPGRWFYEESAPAGGRCGAGVNFHPCFVSRTDLRAINGADQEVNAMRVNLTLSPTNQIRHFFASVLGQRTGAFSVTATSTVVPRHGVFLIDLSRSVYRDTHLYTKIGGAKRSEYAFSFKNGKHCPYVPNTKQLYPYDEADYSWLNDKNNPIAVDPSDGNPLDFYVGAVGDEPIDAPQSPRSLDPRVHYRDHVGVTDYECFDIPSGASTQSFLIDTYRDVTHTGPEPLTGVLNGIHTAMENVRQNAIVADKIGILGFDTEFLTQRKLNLEKPGDAEFEAFYNATDTTKSFVGSACCGSSCSCSQDRNDKFLFPRQYDSVGKAALTDIPGALDQAIKMLTFEDDGVTPRSDFVSSQNFVVLFSDGINNCYSGSSPRCTADPRPGTGAAGDPAGRSNVWQSIGTDVKGRIDSMTNKRIQFHMFLFGEGVIPHTLLKRYGNGCMTDSQVRLLPNDPYTAPHPYTNPDAWDANGNNIDNGCWPPSETCKFYRPNQLWDYLRDNGGIWAPVRPACNPGVDLTAPFNAVCSDSSIANLQLVTHDDVNRINPSLAGYVDKMGRLTCDPLGRDNNDQIRGYISQVMGRNPFVLVE